jgi:hypothetical protein
VHGKLCNKFIIILQYTPILSPPFRAHDVSLFFVTEELNKPYIKTHIILNYSGKNLPPFATGEEK